MWYFEASCFDSKHQPNSYRAFCTARYLQNMMQLYDSRGLNGRLVIVHDLTTRPEYNLCKGRITGHSDGRWHVQLLHAPLTTLRVSTSNLSDVSEWEREIMNLRLSHLRDLFDAPGTLHCLQTYNIRL